MDKGGSVPGLELQAERGKARSVTHGHGPCMRLGQS